MSDSLSIAAVTETLCQFLSTALLEHNGGGVPGARVTHVTPADKLLESNEPTVNVYLFLAAIDPHLRNANQPTRSPTGALLALPNLPLNLTYLISFHGDERKLEPQRLLGPVLAALNGHPVMGPALIQYVIDHTPWLKGCNLATSGEAIKVTPASFSSVDELGSFWMNFAGTGHRLAMLFEASVLVVDTPGVVTPQPPVEEIDLAVGKIGGTPDHPTAPLFVSFAWSQGKLVATITPPVRPRAGCMLILHDAAPPHAAVRRVLAEPSPDRRSDVPFDLTGAAPGSYFARVIADGAWSAFTRDAAGEPDGPVVTVPKGEAA